MSAPNNNNASLIADLEREVANLRQDLTTLQDIRTKQAPPKSYSSLETRVLTLLEKWGGLDPTDQHHLACTIAFFLRRDYPDVDPEDVGFVVTAETSWRRMCVCVKDDIVLYGDQVMASRRDGLLLRLRDVVERVVGKE